MNKTWQWIVKGMAALIMVGVTYLIADVRQLRADMAEVKTTVAVINTKVTEHLRESGQLGWSSTNRVARFQTRANP